MGSDSLWKGSHGRKCLCEKMEQKAVLRWGKLQDSFEGKEKKCHALFFIQMILPHSLSKHDGETLK